MPEGGDMREILERGAGRSIAGRMAVEVRAQRVEMSKVDPKNDFLTVQIEWEEALQRVGGDVSQVDRDLVRRRQEVWQRNERIVELTNGAVELVLQREGADEKQLQDYLENDKKVEEDAQRLAKAQGGVDSETLAFAEYRIRQGVGGRYIEAAALFYANRAQEGDSEAVEEWAEAVRAVQVDRDFESLEVGQQEQLAVGGSEPSTPTIIEGQVTSVSGPVGGTNSGEAAPEAGEVGRTTSNLGAGRPDRVRVRFVPRGRSRPVRGEQAEKPKEQEGPQEKAKEVEPWERKRREVIEATHAVFGNQDQEAEWRQKLRVEGDRPIRFEDVMGFRRDRALGGGMTNEEREIIDALLRVFDEALEDEGNLPIAGFIGEARVAAGDDLAQLWQNVDNLSAAKADRVWARGGVYGNGRSVTDVFVGVQQVYKIMEQERLRMDVFAALESPDLVLENRAKLVAELGKQGIVLNLSLGVQKQLVEALRWGSVIFSSNFNAIKKFIERVVGTRGGGVFGAEEMASATEISLEREARKAVLIALLEGKFSTAESSDPQYQAVKKYADQLDAGVVDSSERAKKVLWQTCYRLLRDNAGMWVAVERLMGNPKPKEGERSEDKEGLNFNDREGLCVINNLPGMLEAKRFFYACAGLFSTEKGLGVTGLEIGRGQVRPRKNLTLGEGLEIAGLNGDQLAQVFSDGFEGWRNRRFYGQDFGDRRGVLDVFTRALAVVRGEDPADGQSKWENRFVIGLAQSYLIHRRMVGALAPGDSHFMLPNSDAVAIYNPFLKLTIEHGKDTVTYAPQVSAVWNYGDRVQIDPEEKDQKRWPTINRFLFPQQVGGAVVFANDRDYLPGLKGRSIAEQRVILGKIGEGLKKTGQLGENEKLTWEILERLQRVWYRRMVPPPIVPGIFNENVVWNHDESQGVVKAVDTLFDLDMRGVRYRPEMFRGDRVFRTDELGASAGLSLNKVLTGASPIKSETTGWRPWADELNEFVRSVMNRCFGFVMASDPNRLYVTSTAITNKGLDERMSLATSDVDRARVSDQVVMFNREVANSPRVTRALEEEHLYRSDLHRWIAEFVTTAVVKVDPIDMSVKSNDPTKDNTYPKVVLIRRALKDAEYRVPAGADGPLVPFDMPLMPESEHGDFYRWLMRVNVPPRTVANINYWLIAAAVENDLLYQQSFSAWANDSGKGKQETYQKLVARGGGGEREVYDPKSRVLFEKRPVGAMLGIGVSIERAEGLERLLREFANQVGGGMFARMKGARDLADVYLRLSPTQRSQLRPFFEPVAWVGEQGGKK